MVNVPLESIMEEEEEAAAVLELVVEKAGVAGTEEK